MVSQKTIKTIQVDRFDGEKRYQSTYQVDTAHLKGIMLLDALEKIKEEDPTLTFRRSCGGGVCGSDGMNINGKNGLACMTRLASLPDKIVIRPLPGFGIVRDLVVDMSRFYQQYYKVKPYLQASSVPERERLQSPEERAKLDGLYECILCGCCTSSCPSYWWNPDKFLGPAAMLNGYRFVADSRDEEKSSRLEKLGDAYSVYRCRTIMNCAYVCPKGLNPSDAANKLKQELAAHALSSKSCKEGE